MSSVILDTLPFRIDTEKLRKTLRIGERSGRDEKVESPAQEARGIGRAKTFCRITYL